MREMVVILRVILKIWGNKVLLRIGYYCEFGVIFGVKNILFIVG